MRSQTQVGVISRRDRLLLITTVLRGLPDLSSTPSIMLWQSVVTLGQSTSCDDLHQSRVNFSKFSRNALEDPVATTHEKMDHQRCTLLVAVVKTCESKLRDSGFFVSVCMRGTIDPGAFRGSHPLPSAVCDRALSGASACLDFPWRRQARWTRSGKSARGCSGRRRPCGRDPCHNRGGKHRKIHGRVPGVLRGVSRGDSGGRALEGGSKGRMRPIVAFGILFDMLIGSRISLGC